MILNLIFHMMNDVDNDDDNNNNVESTNITECSGAEFCCYLQALLLFMGRFKLMRIA